ncbi:MAG: chemotaxis protein CheA [Proteobacteria bacterium]|nr:chemotaxis protein CheA [Pseudomonadota bacterium]
MLPDEIHESLLATFREESLEQLTELETTLMELEISPNDPEVINKAFRTLHTIKGNAGMFGFEDIEAYTHDLESAFDFVRKGTMKVCPELIDLTLRARDGLLVLLQGTGDPNTVRPEMEKVMTLVAEFLSQGQKVILDDPGQEAAGKKEDRGQGSGGGGAREKPESSVRVASGKLDQLVNLVGEMVTVQARLTQLVSERPDPALEAVAEEVESLTWELRENAFSIRMIPIETTYRRIKRLVRDLSRELGQEVELITEGAETELDKNVIEKLTDPLMHLIRNSVDHGIESAGERIQAGKPEKGNIRLSATNAGADVVIRVEDDGRGLDAEGIRKKAVEKGLVPAEVDLSTADIYSLIFAPGFSTASQVTNISGRGVGLDVVKKAAEELRGNLTVDSVPGQGTTFIIRLPLTLAIIDGLLVNVAENKYIVPLSIVEECVFLTSEAIKSSHNRRIIRLRGEIVPYISMREWFGILSEPPDIQQVVVVREGDRRIGLLLDHVIGEHQTVIKSLGKVYRNVDGVSGATILGDGTISLILDVSRIMRVTEETESPVFAA